MIDCCLTSTKAKLFFLCAYLEPDNIVNCKLSEFNILQRVLCTAAAISFNRPARGRIFFSINAIVRLYEFIVIDCV
jgi:hypothetical protein